MEELVSLPDPEETTLSHTEQESLPNLAVDSQIPALLRLNTYKAGLDGLDTERANRIIKTVGARKGSRFYEHQEKRQRRIDAQIAELKKRAEQLSDAQRVKAMVKADALLEEMDARRRMNRVIVHFDMDMFFAACEIKHDPSLADKPMAVGSNSMISTSNYIARKFGVRSAMAGFIGKRLCPQLILVPPHGSLYKRESEFIMNIIQQYDPNPCSNSLDEVHIDLTEYLFEVHCKENPDTTLEQLYALDILPDNVWETAAKIVNGIRERVHKESGLTVSAGISCNTMVAKICTDMNKPNGQHMVRGRRDEVMEFVSTLKLRKFPGVGPVRGQLLAGLGMESTKDIYAKRDLVMSLFSELNAQDNFRLYLGLGSTTLVQEETAQKSHSREHTMAATDRLKDLCVFLRSLSDQLSRDLQRHEQLGRTITLKLKKVSFEVFLKSKSINTHTDDADVLYRVAKELLQQEYSASPTQAYRLIGIKISSLKDKQANAQQDQQQTTLMQLVNKMQASSSKQDTSFKNKVHICRLCEQEFPSGELLSEHKNYCNGDFQAFGFDDEQEDEIYELSSPSLSASPVPSSSSDSRPNSSADVLLDPRQILKIEHSSTSQVSRQSEPQVQEAPLESMRCPICNSNLMFENNASLNAHIDTCLNRGLCTELTRVSRPESSNLHSVAREESQPQNGKKRRDSSVVNNGNSKNSVSTNDDNNNISRTTVGSIGVIPKNSLNILLPYTSVCVFVASLPVPKCVSVSALYSITLSLSLSVYEKFSVSDYCVAVPLVNHFSLSPSLSLGSNFSFSVSRRPTASVFWLVCLLCGCSVLSTTLQ